MGTVDTLMADGVELALDDWGVSTTYTAKGAVARTIKAVFTRVQPENIPGTTGFSAAVEVQIADHATLGTTAIVFGGDSIVVPVAYGGDGSAWPIMDFIDRVAGWWHVRVYVNR